MDAVKTWSNDVALALKKLLEFGITASSARVSGQVNKMHWQSARDGMGAGGKRPLRRGRL